MTKILIASLLSALGAYGAVEIADTILPAYTEGSAQVNANNIADAAYITWTLTGGDWPTVLADTVRDARHNDNTTVTGTTLRWEEAGHCYLAEIPTPDTEPTVKACE
jgi:hypothetical protein